MNVISINFFPSQARLFVTFRETVLVIHIEQSLASRGFARHRMKVPHLSMLSLFYEQDDLFRIPRTYYCT